MTLGEKLTAARQARGMTQAQAAGEAITRNMLSQLEHDQAEPSLKTLRYLAARLEVPISWLLEDSDGASVLEQARQCYRSGDYAACVRLLEAQRTPLTEEGQLLGCRAALAAAWAALDRGDAAETETMAALAERWAAGALYLGPETGAALCELRLRLALEQGQELAAAQAAWEAAWAPAEARRQLLLARLALAEGRLREAAQALRRAEGGPAAETALLRGLLEAARGRHREAAAQLSRAEAGELSLPDRRRCLAALEQSALALEDYQTAYACAAKARALPG